MELKITGVLAEVIVREAARRGLDVESFLAYAVSIMLDPRGRVELYTALSRRYLEEAEKLQERGELAQAGEKLWGAVASLLNAIAEKRGWPHYSHRDYVEIIERLFEETGDRELLAGFAMAERLHANFYHNFMRVESFRVHREAVLKLLERLRQFL